MADYEARLGSRLMMRTGSMNSLLHSGQRTRAVGTTAHSASPSSKTSRSNRCPHRVHLNSLTTITQVPLLGRWPLPDWRLQIVYACAAINMPDVAHDRR